MSLTNEVDVVHLIGIGLGAAMPGRILHRRERFNLLQLRRSPAPGDVISVQTTPRPRKDTRSAMPRTALESDPQSGLSRTRSPQLAAREERVG